MVIFIQHQKTGILGQRFRGYHLLRSNEKKGLPYVNYTTGNAYLLEKFERGVFMKKQFEQFGTLMAEAREALKAIHLKQNEEIGAVNAEHRPMLDAYEQKRRDVDDVIEGFENQTEEDIDYDDMLDEQQKAMREIERLNEDFETNWGKDLDAHEEKIARIKAKYEQMYQKTMTKAGYTLGTGAKQHG